jgi:hypothetical protein
MGNVRRMSQVCMWLRHGRIEMFGPTHEVVLHYEKQTTHEGLLNVPAKLSILSIAPAQGPQN